MNFMNRFFLKLTLLPTSFYRRMGVDTMQLKAIVTTKLIMDDRRPQALAQVKQRKQSKPVSGATLGTMFVSALLGLLYLFFFFFGKDMVTHLTFYFTIFFIMLSLTLIADFTSVLIDVRDNFIILPKPVNDRTFVVARLLHIFIHVCKIVLPMSLPALITIGFESNIYGSIILLLTIFLLTAFSIFFINAAYLLILKLITPQRFQSIISYVQIVFAILIYASYQIVPRIIDRLHFDEFDVSTKKGILFFPLYWLANSWQLLYSFKGNTTEIAMGILGLLFPFVCVTLVVKYLAPSFNQKLALITNTSAPSKEKIVVGKHGKQNSYASILSKLFTHSAVERASFDFTWKMMARSRDFKLKVYPSIGYLIVYAVIMFINKNFSIHQLQQDPARLKILVITALYVSSLLLIMAIGQVIYSDKYKASWVFYTSPIEKPGDIVSGAAKAAILKFYVPIVVVITTAALLLAGLKILPNILLGLFNEVVIAALLLYVGKKHFPFSTSQNTNAKTGAFLRGFFIFGISALIAFGHFLVYNFLPVIIIGAVLSIIASWTVFNSIKQLTWDKMMSKYSEE